MEQSNIATAEQQQKGGRSLVDCGLSASIADSAAFKIVLQEALEAGRPVALQAGALQRVDAAFLQMLVGFVRAASDAGIDVTWASTSEAMREAVSLLGLQKLLHLDSAFDGDGDG